MPRTSGQLPGTRVREGASDPSNGQSRRPVPRLARQRRPGWILAGIVLMAIFVMSNVYLFRSSSHRVPVVRVLRDVPIGQQITQADVGTISVAPVAGLKTIPVRQLPEVLGWHAAVDLRQGSLLTASQVTRQLTPQHGQALVTVALKPSQLPPGGLEPGSHVRIVSTPAGGQDGGTPSRQSETGSSTPQDVPATVDRVGGPDADGMKTVSLLVADNSSSAVARQASTGRIALVVTTRGG